MTDWFRYGYPRRWLVRLCGLLERPFPGAYERLLDFLYPSDAVISFEESQP